MPDHDDLDATRSAYDDTADLYAKSIGTEITSRVEAPIDRALLAAFVESVAGSGRGLIGDLGCGTGRVAALLAAHGLDVVGVDLSPGMLAIARDAHPAIRFEVGELAHLPLPDGALAGAVCWYSIIHTPLTGLGAVVVELARVLAADAPLLVAFQAGDGERVHRTEVQGRAVSLTSHRHSPEDVAEVLGAGGFEVTARVLRAAEAAHETGPQAFLFARRGAATTA